MAYARLEPFGEKRADLRAAMHMALLANIHRDPEKHPDPFTPADYMPVFSPGDVDDNPAGRQQNVDELAPEAQVFVLEMMNAMFGGKDLRGNIG